MTITNSDGTASFLDDLLSRVREADGDDTEPRLPTNTPVRRGIAFLQEVNAILRGEGYRMGERGGIMCDRDMDRIDQSIKYGVSPAEFADVILTRDGFRQPMTTSQAGAL